MTTSLCGSPNPPNSKFLIPAALAAISDAPRVVLPLPLRPVSTVTAPSSNRRSTTGSGGGASAGRDLAIGAARTALEAVFKPVYSEICTSFYWYDPNTCVSYWPVTQVCHLQGGGNCHTSGGDCHTSCSWSGLKLRCNTNCNPVVTTCDPIYSVCNNIGGGCAIWQPLVLRCGTYVNTCMLNCF